MIGELKVFFSNVNGLFVFVCIRIKRGEGGDPALIKNKVFWHAESHRILVLVPVIPQGSN